MGVEFEADAFDGSWQDGQGTIYLPSAATIVQATFAGFIAIDVFLLSVFSCVVYFQGKGANEVEFSGCVFENNKYGLSNFNSAFA